MRSRYAAYALGLSDYILETTDPEGPLWRADQDAWREQIAGWIAETRFLGLKVEAFEAEEAEAWVTFDARLFGEGKAYSLRERSRFVLRDGRWLYCDGVPN